MKRLDSSNRVEAEEPDRSESPFPLERTISLKEAKGETSSLPTDVVVKFYGTGVRPSYLLPWQVGSQTSWTGTGFVLPGQRLMTNVHVVQDSTVLQVTKQDDSKKYAAQVACVAHDLDLALVVVDDSSFWENLPHAIFAPDLPDLYSQVKAVGFPTGGTTVCVTKGIVSRVDSQVYVHPRCLGINSTSKSSHGGVLILQIDAAINPGNSGGPAFDWRGHVVGIASSGMPNQQNVGYVIPACIAQMFLAEFESSSQWSGISQLGFSCRQLESEAMRKFLKVGDEKGVLVTSVAPMGALHQKMKEGDVITHVDGLDVTNEGEYPIIAAGQKIFLNLDSRISQKLKGESTTFTVLREGDKLEVTAVLAPITPLTPRFHAYDSMPDFVLIGGIVFTRGTVPLQNQYLQSRKTGYPFISDKQVWDEYDKWKEDPEHELVVLLTILKHEVNLGYGHTNVGVLTAFNERPVRSLADLARFYGEALQGTDDFLRFYLSEGDAEDAQKGRDPGSGPRIPDIVLERKKVEAADHRICATNNIPAVTSMGLLPTFQQACENCSAVGPL